MKLFRRGPSRLERQLTQADLEIAIGRAGQAIPAGTLIFTSWSPKVEVAHMKSALNLGSVCEAHSLREDWLGTGSDEEREHAASLRVCGRCVRGSHGHVPGEGLVAS